MIGRDRGFTLVELLVSMTLFALLATILFGALRFGMRAAEQGTARVEWMEEVTVAENLLRSQIAAAVPLQKNEDGQVSIAFEGEPDSVGFTGLPPAHLAPGGWNVLHVGFEAEQGRLVLTWGTVEEAGGDAPRHRTVLLDGVSGVAFGYFGATAPGEDLQWHDRWESVNAMPLLMRLSIDFTNGRHVPDLMIALRAAPPAPGF